jgi:hypothetical protein
VNAARELHLVSRKSGQHTPRLRRKSRGRRKFKGSKFAGDATLANANQAPRPYGWAWPVGDHRNRGTLLRFFLPVIAGTSEFPGAPFNSTQRIDRILGEKQWLSVDPALMRQLDYYQRCENANMPPHPFWNCPELPLETLRQALSLCPAHVLQHYPVVQRALGRLYAVAWWGSGVDSAEAKKQLEALIPAGNAHPITKHIPELAEELRKFRRWIRESNELMKAALPREDERVKSLAELYDEPKDVIYSALHDAEKSFVGGRLAQMLGIPFETVRKALRLR